MRLHLLVLLIIYANYLCLCLPFCLCISENEVSNEKAIANDILKDVVEPSNKVWSSGGGGNGLLQENPPTCLAPINVPYPTSSVDPKIFTGRRYFYYSGGSYYGYEVLAKMLLGRNVFNKDELDKMCPGMSIGAAPVLFHGYGVQSALHCQFSQHRGNCTVSTDPQEYDGKLGVNPYLVYTTMNVYLVATDSKTYAMYYLCMDGTRGDYQLLTTRPFLSPDVMEVFLSMKNKLGFYQSQPLFPVCRSPFTNKPYPFPFQNYPASGNVNLVGWSLTVPIPY